MEDDALKTIQEYAKRPFKFIEEYFGFKLRWYQKLWIVVSGKFTRYRRQQKYNLVVKRRMFWDIRLVWSIL